MSAQNTQPPGNIYTISAKPTLLTRFIRAAKTINGITRVERVSVKEIAIHYTGITERELIRKLMDGTKPVRV